MTIRYMYRESENGRREAREVGAEWRTQWVRQEPIQRGLSISVMDDLTRGPQGVSASQGKRER